MVSQSFADPGWRKQSRSQGTSLSVVTLWCSLAPTGSDWLHLCSLSVTLALSLGELIVTRRFHLNCFHLDSLWAVLPGTMEFGVQIRNKGPETNVTIP